MKEVICPCGVKITGETEQDIVEQGKQHAMNIHGYTEEDFKKPEVQAQMEEMRTKITDVSKTH